MTEAGYSYRGLKAQGLPTWVCFDCSPGFIKVELTQQRKLYKGGVFFDPFKFLHKFIKVYIFSGLPMFLGVWVLPVVLFFLSLLLCYAVKLNSLITLIKYSSFLISQSVSVPNSLKVRFSFMQPTSSPSPPYSIQKASIFQILYYQCLFLVWVLSLVSCLRFCKWSFNKTWHSCMKMYVFCTIYSLLYHYYYYLWYSHNKITYYSYFNCFITSVIYSLNFKGGRNIFLKLIQEE